MSRRFSASTHLSNHGTSTTLRQNTGFVAAWVQIASFVTGVTGLKLCGTDGVYWGLWLDGGFDGSGHLYFDIQRATTNLIAHASSDPLVVGVPQFVAVSWNTSGANSDQKLYTGSLNRIVSEVATYATQEVGAGTRSTPTTAFTIGNALGGESYSYFNGSIDTFIYLNRQPLLKEIIELQGNMYAAPGTQLVTRLGNVSREIDLIGNHGAVTGASIAPPLPVNYLHTPRRVYSFAESVSQISVNDICSASDSITPAPSVTSAESFSSNDALNLSASVSQSESFTLSENLEIALNQSESFDSAESLSVDASISLSETFTETETLEVALNQTDAFSSNDALNVATTEPPS